MTNHLISGRHLKKKILEGQNIMKLSEIISFSFILIEAFQTFNVL